MMVAAADALVGGVAAAVPASISDTLSWGNESRCFAWLAWSSGRPRSLCAADIAVTGSALALTNQAR